MNKKTPPSPLPDLLNQVLTETFIIDAMVKADAWNLEHYASCPRWIQEMYQRHAAAACYELRRLRDRLPIMPPAH